VTHLLDPQAKSHSRSGISFPSELPTGILIAGRWHRPSAGAELLNIDPATEEVYATLAAATTDHVDAALAAAHKGWLEWRSIDAWTRSAILRRVAEVIRDWDDQMALVMTSEQGKPLAESLAEVRAAADQFDWYADEARRIYGRTVQGHSTGQRLIVNREPIGPVVAFSTWNFPALLPARKIAPALAAGCSVIVVAAEETPLTASLLAQACLEAGVHAAAISVLVGNAPMVSDRLIRSSVVRKISLTGSVEVGRILLRAAAERIIPATMELGGHAPVLVFADADIELAAQACVRAKYRNAGQVCASPSRFFVHEDVLGDFTDVFVKAAAALRVGDGREADSEVGPLTSERRRVAADRLVADAVAKGAHVAAGGGRDDSHERGYFYQPTVLTSTNVEMCVMQEEPFAPVAPITSFKDLAEVLVMANGTPYGLASFIFTRDLSTAMQVSEGLEAGMVGINTLLVASAEVPFGGVKDSGFGREGGSEGIGDYTVAKYLTIGL
jgi:succinate-semialdehyde dehydrogenase / glutarate-semialdehyde dehydrogenase